MKNKQISLSDLKHVRGALAIGKWTKSDKFESESDDGLIRCKCHDEVRKNPQM
ncbi:MAG: hypothetical protein AAF799_30425 [Myxococcota bacterium]